MKVDRDIAPEALRPKLRRVFELAEAKIAGLDKAWDESRGAPVITAGGKYTSRGWTEWTQGFQYGMALLAFDATGSKKMLELGRERTLEKMLVHVTHSGVHDHGFNNVSTYGNLRRLIREGKAKNLDGDLQVCETALKCSGAVQAMRWSGAAVRTPAAESAGATSLGYVYSFNGPHSLFIDTMRSMRSLSLAWQLGHVLAHENDKRASLLKRSVLHALTTSQYLIYHGTTDSPFDVAGRTAHEAVFNRNDGSFRSRATQQGYSPYSTWTRGLAWAVLGFAEQLEFLGGVPREIFERETGLDKKKIVALYLLNATQLADHYLRDATAGDGIPYWDDGAPGLSKMGGWRDRPAEPFNEHEPVDSSAAAIAAQGLWRLGKILGKQGTRYSRAAIGIAGVLFDEPYLAADKKHQGLLLHSIYHRPNNWDAIPPGRKIPCGESSMWGDYHLLELALLLWRAAGNGAYITFFDS